MNLFEVLTATGRESPEAPALHWHGETLSHGEVRELALRAAGGLAGMGVGPGDRVGIVCQNHPGFVVSYLGCLAAGAVAVPVNPIATSSEVAAELSGTGAKVVLIGPGGRPAFEAAGLSDVTAVDVDPSGRAGALLAAAPNEAAERSGDDLAVLVHTSGTSGAPRAAMLTHRNLASNIEQAQGHPGVRLEPSDVGLGVLPCFHVYGLNAVLGLALAAGASLVLVERFDPAESLALVRDHGVTVLPGVPPMFGAWLGLGEAGASAFAGVRTAVSGAAPLSVDVQQAFRSRFGIEVHQGYGLTEASPIVTSTLAGEVAARPGSIGVPLPGIELRLVDSDGGDTLFGDPGEIWVRGENVFAGYWEDAEASARVLTPDGWLKTGDIGVADDDGYISIVDRSKDLIIVSGFNVYPAEVEDVIARHPAVAEAAVVGAPDASTGEAVRAYVVPVPGQTLTLEELADHCRRFLARYKCPTSVEVVSELPRGLAGKLLRRSLTNQNPA